MSIKERLSSLFKPYAALNSSFRPISDAWGERKKVEISLFDIFS